jgi:hypothetical protein
LIWLSGGKTVDKEAGEERLEIRYAAMKMRERMKREKRKGRSVKRWVESKHRDVHSLTMRTSQCFVNSSKCCHGEEHISVRLYRKHQSKQICGKH